MRTIRCRLAVSALLALVLGDALAMGADVVKIGAIFEDSKEVIFDGTQTWGWAANHAEAAAAAVARINSDDAILPGVEIQLVRIHVEALRAAAWMEGDCSRASERCFLRQFHDTEAVRNQNHNRKSPPPENQMENFLKTGKGYVLYLAQ